MLKARHYTHTAHGEASFERHAPARSSESTAWFAAYDLSAHAGKMARRPENVERAWPGAGYLDQDHELKQLMLEFIDG